MAFKILKTPITDEILGKIVTHGEINIYHFKEGSFDRPVCECYDVRQIFTSEGVIMEHCECPINTSCSKNQLSYSPAEILKFVNKMINASKTDKTIKVYARNISEDTLKGKRTTSPARKIYRKPSMNKVLRR